MYFFFVQQVFKGIIGLERDPLGEQQQISTGVGVAVQRLREGGLDGEAKPKKEKTGENCSDSRDL